MDKTILQDYIDACELIKETERDIHRLNQKKKTVIQTNVKGSMPEFPYVEQHFKIQGTTFTVKDDNALRYEEKLLEQRKVNAEQIKIQVEEWMLTLPSRMQRIVKYRYLEGLSWEKVAEKMGRKATENSVKKEFERAMKNF
ncbi:MAG: sigma-70 family RNA polymerase sigma factor [Lachnospiraceae bacterium]|nr:sigma-70 family RNA polymerase sigma factor [Lachnospiraceae bacterium]